MNEESLIQRVLHLRQVEQFSERQISKELLIGRKRVRMILNGLGLAKSIQKKAILDDYINLIGKWYSQYPHLKATQIYERLISYGYQGSYASVVRLSREYRKPKQNVYHPLTFLPGEEAQIDWFFFNHESIGNVAGFVYILAYSRYAWGHFYPRTTFEFFLAGHLECFKHIGGMAHSHRYDNLKSVVLKRHPEIEYNGQFLDFARFHGFSIHLCNPYKGNEKGRVERIIRDIRAFLYGETFDNLDDLNQKFHIWLEKRNTLIHRSTGKTPLDLLKQERLINLPEQSYLQRRIIQAVVSKTALVEFETNKYSVPSFCSTKSVEISAYPKTIEIFLSDKKVAVHKRYFEKKKIIMNPLHSEKLLNQTPQFKMQRILQLITNMDPAFNHFLINQDDDTKRIDAAYQLFQFLKTYSRAILISAVRELNSMSCFKIKALKSLLNLPQTQEPDTLWPQKSELLNIKYKERSLNDYDSD